MEKNTKTVKKTKPQQNRRKPVKKKQFLSPYIIIGSVILTVVVILGAALIFTSDRVIEDDTVSSEADEILSAVSSDEMGFPVVFSNNDILQAESFSSRIFVLGKKILTCVSA